MAVFELPTSSHNDSLIGVTALDGRQALKLASEAYDLTELDLDCSGLGVHGNFNTFSIQ